MLSLPICSAKKLAKKPTGELIQSEEDNILTQELEDEYVEGYFYEDINYLHEKVYLIRRAKDNWLFEVDPSTLRVSFNNGENFDSISFIQRAIEDHREGTGAQE